MTKFNVLISNYLSATAGSHLLTIGLVFEYPHKIPIIPSPPDCLKSPCKTEIVRIPIHDLKRILDSREGMFNF